MKKLGTMKLLLIGGIAVGGFLLYSKRKKKGLKTWNPMVIFGKDKDVEDVEIVGDIEE